MQRVYRQIARVGSADYPVVIIGETGTGKELVARAIHNHARSLQPFIAVDCAALVPTLFESEMFGSVKGAYTGAIANRIGLMERAGRGTMFLDEISNLPLGLQPKLLRALQAREMRPVGSNETRRFAARVIAASNIPLERAVRDQRFRKDLLYRLNVVQITLPPLRSRREDIELLVWHMVAQSSQESNTPREISPDALRRLEQYDWPGNIRQLENVVQKAMAIEDGPVLEFLDFPPADVLSQSVPMGGPVEPLVSIERRALLRAVEIAGSKQLAAKMLGIGKTTIYRKLKEYESF